ncbi:hypothetical protein DSECCO2_630780 [anaerobic digester metagenome]
MGVDLRSSLIRVGITGDGVRLVGNAIPVFIDQRADGLPEEAGVAVRGGVVVGPVVVAYAIGRAPIVDRAVTAAGGHGILAARAYQHVPVDGVPGAGDVEGVAAAIPSVHGDRVPTDDTIGYGKPEVQTGLFVVCDVVTLDQQAAGAVRLQAAATAVGDGVVIEGQPIGVDRPHPFGEDVVDGGIS